MGGRAHSCVPWLLDIGRDDELHSVLYHLLRRKYFVVFSLDEHTGNE